MDFELTQLVLSFILNQLVLSSCRSKEPSYQVNVRWTMQDLTEPFFNIIGCCNFTEAKGCEVVQFTGQGAIQNDACNKTLRLALEYIKIHRSGISIQILTVYA